MKRPDVSIEKMKSDPNGLTVTGRELILDYIAWLEVIKERAYDDGRAHQAMLEVRGRERFIADFRVKQANKSVVA